MALRPEDWAFVKELFECARVLSADARASYLAEACGNEAVQQEVELLLVSREGAKSFLETSAGVLFDDPMLTNNLEGQHLGAYQLSSRIGAGGMARCIAPTIRAFTGTSPSTLKRHHLPTPQSGLPAEQDDQLRAPIEFLGRFQ